jgi:hypothetical protein
MPLFTKGPTGKSEVYLLVYFPNPAGEHENDISFCRHSFDSKKRAKAIKDFENAILKQRWYEKSLVGYKTAMIKDGKTNEVIIKYVRGVRK